MNPVMNQLINECIVESNLAYYVRLAVLDHDKHWNIRDAKPPPTHPHIAIFELVLLFDHWIMP